MIRIEFLPPWTTMGTVMVALSLNSASAQSPDFGFEPALDRGLNAEDAPAEMGAGVAAADFDGDGFVDLFVPTGPGVADHLFWNRGHGVYVDVAAHVGLDRPKSSRNALWFDYDGDGNLDLLIANDDPIRRSTFELYRQDRGVGFVDVTWESGIGMRLPPAVDPVVRIRSGMAAGDLDGDGDLDVVMTIWNGWPTVFENQGDGTFKNVTTDSQVRTPVPFSHQAVLHDFNGDGLLDIYISVDFQKNVLWRNLGAMRFEEVGRDTGIDNMMNDMGISLGDFDRDGDFDVYVTNIDAPAVHNVLLRNDLTSVEYAFEDVAEDLEVEAGGWGWGATFFDADNDGWLDIAATNGWNSPNYIHDRSKLFWNRGTVGRGTAVDFDDVSETVGFNDDDWGSSLVAFDADRDGDLELVQRCMTGTHPLRMLDNDARQRQVPANEYLVIKPRMPDSMNTHAIGAVVVLRHEGATQRRLITAGTSYSGQEPAEAFFGVGGEAEIEILEIHWPDGRFTIFEDVKTARIYEVTIDRRDSAIMAEWFDER